MKIGETGWLRSSPWLPHVIVTLGFAWLVAATLGIAFLNSDNWPTGGDAASHLLYAQQYADELLFSGHVLPWMPEVFGGMPFLSYYFPLPFIVIAVLSKGFGLASAFKWGGFLAAMLLPGAVCLGSRRWLAFSWPAALFGALGTFAFLLHEQNSIWGGNLLSTLAGEFAYSYGLFFAVLAMLAWAAAIHRGRGWLLAALLEAASGFSHGFPLLVVGFSTALLLIDASFAGGRGAWRPRFVAAFRQLFCGHLLAFALLGGWLWPMLEMHGLTIPNDASFPIGGWRDLLPASLWPLAAGGGFGLLALALPRVRRVWGGGQRLALLYLFSAALLAALAFLAGDQLGLADIRFFPLVWLLGAIACGWLAGQALHGLMRAASGDRRGLTAEALFVVAGLAGGIGWVGQQVHMAPDWGFWNHSGLQAKPQWHNLSQLFPALRGDLWSPRLAFEHDPANNDLGSTRTLEALPMFLNGRPVLEGLYMESGLLGPAIYQLQSEISAQPSSPLVRFPSGSLDPEFAARHLEFLHADTLLIRSDRARQALEASGLYVKVAESLPFSVYRLKSFNSQLARVVTQPVRARPKENWMQDAFAWFRTRSRFEAYLPVYGLPAEALPTPASETQGGPTLEVRPVALDRHRLVFETDAVGRPHLIKMAFHPRWHLESRGALTIAGPGYMLVVPQEKEIRLEFGHTTIGRLGIAATTLALILTLVLAWRGRRCVDAAPDAPAGVAWNMPIAAAWLLLAAAGIWFAVYSPERVYARGWEAFNRDDFKAAAEHFRHAYQLRRPPAKKEEALFWLAKASERGGDPGEAVARYRELCERYHGFWLPESLYTLIKLEKQAGKVADAAMVRRLREEYPNNPWTQRLEQGQ